MMIFFSFFLNKSHNVQTLIQQKDIYHHNAGVYDHTLCGVATCSILNKDVVEGLVGTVGQLVDPHGGDPLLAHGALRVPAVDHTVIT